MDDSTHDTTADTAGVTPEDDESEWLEPEDCTDEELMLDWVYPEEMRAEDERRRRRAREKWRSLPDEPLPEAPPVTTATVGTLFRAVRWRCRMSQRELSVTSGIPLSTVSRAEGSDDADLRLSTLQRLVEVCGLRLAIVDDEGTHLTIPFGQERFRDDGERRLPAHLETYDPRGSYWWGHGLIGGPDPRHPEPPRVYLRRRRTYLSSEGRRADAARG